MPKSYCLSTYYQKTLQPKPKKPQMNTKHPSLTKNKKKNYKNKIKEA